MKNFLILSLGLGIVCLTIIPEDKIWCNALNEVAYSFSYAIQEPGFGVVTQHWEERRADLVRGSYSFLEPTGKVRVVHYQVTGKHGFRAVVTYRRPPLISLRGHLEYPKYFRHAIVLAEPVGLITPDLFIPKKTYPNLPA